MVSWKPQRGKLFDFVCSCKLPRNMCWVRFRRNPQKKVLPGSYSDISSSWGLLSCSRYTRVTRASCTSYRVENHECPLCKINHMHIPWGHANMISAHIEANNKANIHQGTRLYTSSNECVCVCALHWDLIQIWRWSLNINDHRYYKQPTCTYMYMYMYVRGVTIHLSFNGLNFSSNTFSVC